MLSITIEPIELFDEVNNRIIRTEQYDVELEHSLVSLSKWESKWKIPFLGKTPKTNEQTIDYVRCMNLTPGVPPEAFDHLTDAFLEQVTAYIQQDMTATTFRETPGARPNREIITAEIIYYWMTQAQVDWRVEEWHLNRLMALLKVVNLKQSPGKKMSKAEIMAQQRALNEQRRQQLGTNG